MQIEWKSEEMSKCHQSERKEKKTSKRIPSESDTKKKLRWDIWFFVRSETEKGTRK